MRRRSVDTAGASNMVPHLQSLASAVRRSVGGPAATVVLVRPPRHAGPAVARDPGGRPLDAGFQLAAPAVLQVEGVQLGQQGDRRSLPQGADDREGVARCSRDCKSPINPYPPNMVSSQPNSARPTIPCSLTDCLHGGRVGRRLWLRVCSVVPARWTMHGLPGIAQRCWARRSSNGFSFLLRFWPYLASPSSFQPTSRV
jgi:hypothetical protein